MIAAFGFAAWACEPPVSDYSGERGERNDGPPVGEEATDINDVLVEKWAVWADGYVHADIVHDGRLGDLYLAVGEERFGTYRAGRRLGSFSFGGFGVPRDQAFQPRLMLSSYLERSERPEVVRVVNDIGVELTTIPVEDRAMRDVGEECHPLIGKDVCAVGTVCNRDRNCATADCQATCKPVEITGREHGETGIRLRVAGIDQFSFHYFRIGGFSPEIGYQETEVEQMDLYLSRFRADTIDLYDGLDLVAANIPIEPVESRAEDEACDITEFLDVCSEGLLCRDAICETAIAPVIESVTAVLTDDAVGVRVVGRDPNLDVRELGVNLTGSDEADDPEAPNEFFFGDRLLRGTYRVSAGRTSRLAFDGDQFTWQLSTRWSDIDMFGGIISGTVRVSDAEDLRSDPFMIELQSAADTPVLELNEICDQAGVFNRCPDGSRCEVEAILEPEYNFDFESRCATTEPLCPEGVAEPLTLEAPVVVEPALSFDDRPMNRLFGNLSCDGWNSTMLMYNFTAPDAGSYRFTVNQTDSPEYVGGFSLAVKDSCMHQFADLGCSKAAFGTNNFADVYVDLAAEQTVAVAVKSLFVFELSVERL